MVRLAYAEERLTLYEGDARQMSDIPDESVALVCCSPPYLNGRDYSHWDTYEAYLADMEAAWKECGRVLMDTGRICINIPPDYGFGESRKHFALDIGEQVRRLFNFWGFIVWNKNATGSSTTAWGSWASASRPNFRGRYELILVASKGGHKRATRGVSDVTSAEFTEYSQNLWSFPGVNGKKRTHPAPFPTTLPYRCIKMLSYVGETVLDPFSGSGTTALVARDTGRIGIGVELHAPYIEDAIARIAPGRATQEKAPLSLGVSHESHVVPTGILG